MKHERAVAYGAFAIVCVVWGTTYLAIRIALDTIPPLLLTGARFTAAGLVMLAISKLRGDAIPRDARTLGNLALIGFLMVGVGNLAVVWAEQWVPSGIAALLVATAPFWMAIIELFRKSGERVSLQSGIGMAIGFCGVAMLVTPRGSGGTFGVGFLLGALAIQIGGMCWQLGSAHGKYNLAHVPLVASAALQMLFGGLIVTIAGFVIGEGPKFAVTPRTLGALAYLTIFGSVIAYSAYVFALAHMSTTHTSLYAYVNPVVAVFLGWLILSEPLTGVSIAAMFVILAGVALVQTAGWKKAQSRMPAASASSTASTTSAIESTIRPERRRAEA
ncbi:MAG: EamA family transporter [Acidobacteriota bacterium]|nr:EamA family transporter [Acidobacteriota bacterium]